ncbi:MAG: chemotaxis protein CheX [Dehalococcoidia bacterium]|uniref:chemotaxis protein CheX n=1 Tax=Candidatus Amarobacter glycogenicus TaxID=3140699 RepID=UPI002A10E4C7|nr:chemotaxis protein CheX [Dehalococcoidia bacterium]MBK9611977.1 chemotaxis protein CheX [Dehalococcoidia bacterium]
MLAKITVAEAAQAAAQAPDRARVELIGPFVEAAARVIQQECGEQVQRGQLHRVRSPQTNNEVSALIAITGGVAGLVIYSMTQDAALGFASKMIGEPLSELDALGQSAIAELANMITGQAGIALEKNGFPSDMSPPVLLLGKGSTIATLNLTRLLVPLVVSFGEFTIDIAVKEV